jgi:hypothetical protein
MKNESGSHCLERFLARDEETLFSGKPLEEIENKGYHCANNRFTWNTFGGNYENYIVRIMFSLTL